MLKRFLTLAALLILAMAWTTMSARWIVGQRKSADQIKAGDTVVIKVAQNDELKDYFLQAADADHESLGVMVAPGMGLGASAIITIEEGPLDLRTEAPTVLLKLVGTNKYVGAKYYDWYNTGQGAVTAPDQAGNFQILSCGQQIPWYTTEGANAKYTAWDRTENAIWDDQSVAFSASPSETDFCYLAYWTYASATPRAITWKYTNTIQWNVYSVSYEKDLREDLEALINTYSNSASDFQGGTNPGYYDQTVISAYESKLEEAMQILYNASATDDEISTVMSDLKNAYKAMTTSIVPLTEGYYYLVCDNEKIINNNMSEKAMYINEALGQVYWGEFDANDSKFVFQITPYDNTQWNVKNVMTDLYLGVPTGFCKPFGVSTDKETPSTFNFYPGTGSCYIKSIAVDGTRWTMCPQGNASGTSAGPSSVWSYNGETTSGGNVPHHEWTWQLRKVDDAVLDRIFAEKEQYDRTNSLIALTQEANDLYDKLFDYKTNTDNGLITDADAQLSFSHVRVQGVPFADKPEYLLDGFDSTYVQASGYMDIAIDKTPTQLVTFAYKRRGATQQYPNAAVWGENERPGSITILATNDTINGGEWTKIADINMGTLEDPIQKTVDLGAPYSYIRYQVNTSKDGGSFFTFSEFQLYAPTVDEANSQYYTEAGMKEPADALKALINAQKEIIANNTVAEADILALQEAYNAVKARYADAEVLQALIKECNDLAINTTVGDGIGQADDEGAIEDMIFAILNAEEIAKKPKLSKSELDKALTDLTAARDEFLTHVKTFEAGKWYYIISNDKNVQNNGKALYMSGYASTSTVAVGLTNEDGSPAYTYDPRAMWTFTATKNGYTIQNMGTGYFLGEYVKKEAALLQSYEGTSYSVKFIGAGSYGLVPQNTTNIAQYAVTANEDKTNFSLPEAETASSWTIIEIDPEETQFITIKDFDMNAQDVIVVPFNMENVNDFNEDVHIYGIKSITQDEEGVSTVEFYEKESAKAGEACWVVLGNPEADSEDYELLIPFPTSITNKATGANGLYGMLHPEGIAEGDVYSTGKALIAAATNDVTISAHTGAILPKLYTGPVAGVETALTLTVKGMSPLPTTNKGDVNNDGSINAADVVSIYNYIISGEESGISLANADVNGDNLVNAADVVAIYNIIIGDSASSRKR